VHNTHQHLISDGLGVAVFGALYGANFVTGLHLSLLLTAGAVLAAAVLALRYVRPGLARTLG
jgi:hypothetical protein